MFAIFLIPKHLYRVHVVSSIFTPRKSLIEDMAEFVWGSDSEDRSFPETEPPSSSHVIFFMDDSEDIRDVSARNDCTESSRHVTARTYGTKSSRDIDPRTTCTDANRNVCLRPASIYSSRDVITRPASTSSSQNFSVCRSYKNSEMRFAVSTRTSRKYCRREGR